MGMYYLSIFYGQLKVRCNLDPGRKNLYIGFMIEKILNALLGSKFEKDLKTFVPLLRKINSYESAMLALSPAGFKQKTAEYRERLARGEKLDDLLPEAFALVREAARRVLGERIFDVQLLGGIALHQGKIMEMKTGEGKTLSSVTAAYLNSLAGQGVHIATVNDYLADRDAHWMGPVYDYLGVSVGAVLPEMSIPERKSAYAKDITYGTNNEFGFDYLRDNMCLRLEDKVQRGQNYCIIDEIDSILIDESRTPLIISGQAEDDTYKYYEVNKLVGELTECEKDPATDDYPENPSGDFKIEEKNKRVTFTDQGMNTIEAVLKRRGLIRDSLFLDENFEYIHYFTQSMKAHHLFKKDVDYVVNDGKVEIVDEFTGRILHGRRYSDGLHQAIEAKERIKIAQRNKTLATITFQNFFRLYNKICGMTGTADTEAKEFAKIYELDVVVIPTNRPVIREDNDDVIFLNESDKFNAICDHIHELHKNGQPVLVGTVSIEKSETLSRLLVSRGIRHEVLNAKNHAREALIIAEAGSEGAVTIATNMAGRGTDIKLGGNPEFHAQRRMGEDTDSAKYDAIYRAEYAKWQGAYDKVKSTGGLFVLGTERHESRRIDNQLRGRSGRQGDPGASQFYISLDDVLMRLFGGDNLKSLMSRIGMKPGEPIFHPWLNKAIEKAQKRVEDRNFEIRKHLLEYDDVLNEQRKYMYGKRDEILQDKELYKRVLATAREIVSDLIDEYFYGKDKTDASLQNLLSQLKAEFFYTAALPLENLREFNAKDLLEYLMDEFEKALLQIQEELGPEYLNNYLRFGYLRYIDAKWQDHLENLNALQEAVSLRAYGQKNPLLEYKLEGFQIFDQMLINIRTEIAKKVLSVTHRPKETLPEQARRRVQGEAKHRQLGQFGGVVSGGQPQAAATQVAERPVQVKRVQPKVGRNDPCPCGSGKKYKKCCGA
jgi:preprotein translocase subunit SecA